MELEAWFDTNIGRVRKSNQDTVGCFPELALFIVADGMGGHAEGEVASRLATDVIRARFADGDSLATATVSTPSGIARLFEVLRRRSRRGRGEDRDTNRLRLAVEAANRRVFDEGQRRQPAQGASMGTTVVTLQCSLPQGWAHWAYVGDSRLYRAREGRLTLLTADHTLYGEAYRGEDKIPADLPHTNRLVRAVGVAHEVEVSTGADRLRSGDLFLLCSDGVSGMVGPEEIEGEMISGRSLTEIGDKLISRALDAGGKDNASALLVRVKDSVGG